jgi:uncharacterized protein (DUF111 family)
LRILYFDCFSGASGDMILGALLDAGLPLDDLRGALGSLVIDRDAIWTERVTRAGITATKFHVRGEDQHHHDHGGDHDHHHALEAHPTLREIGALIDGSCLSTAGKGRAKELFARLGEAESAIHGTPMDEVHLHEVGALDSIIDIVGTVWALETMGWTGCVVAAQCGRGTVRLSHGVYPVPAPATARLLQGASVYSGHKALSS